MSGHFATSAVRRRWGVCDLYARRQDAGWPRREREERRTRAQDRSTLSYLALDGQDASRGLELAIIELVVSSPEYCRHFPLAALSEAFEPVRLSVLHAALRRLEEQGILIQSQDGLGLSCPVRALVDLGLIPQA